MEILIPWADLLHCLMKVFLSAAGYGLAILHMERICPSFGCDLIRWSFHFISQLKILLAAFQSP